MMGSTEERYGRAISSSHLELREASCDLDVLIAAGLISGPGAAVFRLRCEFDNVRGPIEVTRRWARSQTDGARYFREKAAVEAKSTDRGPTREQRYIGVARGLEDGALASTKTEYVLVLNSLRSRREALQAVGQLALQEAKRRRLARESSVVMVIAGRVLDKWLDPTCPHCQGRGFVGGSHRGEQKVPCKPCRGSKERNEPLGKDDIECLFASYLQMQLNAMLADVERQIRANGWRVDEAKRQISKQLNI